MGKNRVSADRWDPGVIDQVDPNRRALSCPAMTIGAPLYIVSRGLRRFPRALAALARFKNACISCQDPQPTRNRGVVVANNFDLLRMLGFDRLASTFQYAVNISGVLPPRQPLTSLTKCHLINNDVQQLAVGCGSSSRDSSLLRRGCR